MFYSDSSDSDDEVEPEVVNIVDVQQKFEAKTVPSSLLPLPTACSNSTPTGTQASIRVSLEFEPDNEVELKEDAKLFGEIIEKMQLMTSNIQIKGIPINLCIAFIIQIAIALKDTDCLKLKDAGYQFECDAEYCYVTVKAFGDSGADKIMMAQKLCNCLTMEDVTNLNIWSILDLKEPMKGLQRVSAFILLHGKVNMYNIKGEICKTAPTREVRQIIKDNFGLEEEDF